MKENITLDAVKKSSTLRTAIELLVGGQMKSQETKPGWQTINPRSRERSEQVFEISNSIFSHRQIIRAVNRAGFLNFPIPPIFL